MYKKELKKKVKNEIICHKYHIRIEDQINILCKLINVSIKLDNQLYERRLEKNPKRGNYIPQRRPQYNRQPHNYQNYGDPKELNAMKQRQERKRPSGKPNPPSRKTLL